MTEEPQMIPEGPAETVAPEEETSDRPDWLPEQFSSPEELAQAYDALKSKDEISFDGFTKEFSETGTLSDESRDKLKDYGIPETMLDAYLEGLSLKAQKREEEIYTSVGGSDHYASMIAWAEKNLSPKEIEAYNETLGSSNQESVDLAIQGLYARYQKTLEPKLMSGGDGKAEPLAFHSLGEVTRAMKDPRYKTDSSYRAKIEAKLARSKVL